VDTRLATELPHVGSYFYRGETAGIQQLTAVQLDKFADVPGIEIAYRHGPVTIYDLQRLRVPDERSGWTGTRAPPGSVVQMMVGILIGSGLALGAGSGAGRAARRGLGRYAAVVGPSLALATAVGSVCVLAVVLILCHAWLGPWTFGSAAVVVLAGHRHILRHALYRALRRIRAQVRSGGWARAAVVLLGAVVAGTAAVVSVSSAYSVEVRAVHEILTDLPGS
jgi:hypothetical protein